MKSKETHKFTAFCVSMCMGVSMFSGFAVSADEPETTPNAPASTVWKVSADTATAGNLHRMAQKSLQLRLQSAAWIIPTICR